MKKYAGINTSFGHNVLENFDEYKEKDTGKWTAQ